MKLTFKKILQLLQKEIVTTTLSLKSLLPLPLKGFSYDSRETKKDYVFFALTGAKTKGVHFLNSLYQKGVRFFIITKKDFREFQQRIGHKPANVLVVKGVITAYGIIAHHYLKNFTGIKIAITGSVGKSSFKEILYQILKTKYSVYKSQGNYNNHLGVPYSIFQITNNYDFYLFELGMNHAGEMKYLSKMVAPQVSIITSIRLVHAGFFEGIKEIAKAKSEIFLGLEKNGIAFLPEGIDQKTTLMRNLSPDVKLFILKKDDLIIDQKITKTMEIKSTFYDKISRSKKEVNNFQLFSENYDFALKVGEHFKLERKTTFQNMVIPTPLPHRLMVAGKHPLVIDDTYNANAFTTHKTLEKIFNLIKNSPSLSLTITLGDMLELGNKTKGIYLSLVKNLNTIIEKNPHTLVSFFLLATLPDAMKIIFNNLKTKNKKLFSDPLDLLAGLKREVNPNSLYYFKASQGIKLSQVVKKFVSDFAKKPQN